jgi:hypothetical protein
MNASKRRAVINCKDKRYPFKLQVTIQEGQVRYDRLDTTPDGRPFFVMTSSVRSARRLAQWILDNTAE